MPEQSIFHTNLAIALDNQNKHKQAENHFLLALKLSPDDPQTLFSYARSLEQQNNYDAAKKLYRVLSKDNSPPYDKTGDNFRDDGVVVISPEGKIIHRVGLAELFSLLLL